MKKRKIIQILVSVVIILSVSAMAFTANAMLCYKYTYGANADNTIQTTASVQANPHSDGIFFRNAFATHRADNLTYLESYAIQLNIRVTAYKLSSVSESFFHSGEVIMNSDTPYINFSNMEPAFTEDERVYELEGEYEVYYPYSGERWATPTIILTPDDTH